MNRSACKLLLHCLAISVCLFSALPLWAEESAHVQIGPKEYVEDHHDVSMSLFDMIEYYPQPGPNLQYWVRPLLPIPPRQYPAHVSDPVLQTMSPLAPMAATIGLNFDGNSADGVAPPDTNGAVGTTQYVQLVNTEFTVYNKSNGAVISGPVATSTLWSGFGGGCQTDNDGDGTVSFDRTANRWVFQQFVVRSLPYMVCIAVSQTSDATGAYYRYAFSFGNTDFPDYPKLGVWSSAYFMSFNIFHGSSFVGPDACAFDRTNLLTGATARPMQCFPQSSSVNPLLPSDLDGGLGNNGGPNYFMTFGSSGVLRLYQFFVSFTYPSLSSFTGPTNISVAAFSPAPSTVTQPSPGETLDTLSDRPMYRLAYRNFGPYESLVFVHSIGNPSGIRWYEIRNPTGVPTVAQQGTFAPDSSNRWMGSTGMDASGNQAIGYSVVNSSTGLDPTVRITGRTPSDPAGTMETEINVVNGTGVQQNTSNRWGDYSAMQVDPVDDCTFWYTQEYEKTTGSFNWSTRIVSFKFPNCVNTPDFTFAFLGGSTQVIIPGNSAAFTVGVWAQHGFTGTVTLSASGMPSGSTSYFTVNPITGGSGTSALYITIPATTLLGNYPITIKGTSGSLVHSITGTLEVQVLSCSASYTCPQFPPGNGDKLTANITLTCNGASNISVSATACWKYEPNQCTTSNNSGDVSSIGTQAVQSGYPGLARGCSYQWTWGGNQHSASLPPQ